MNCKNKNDDDFLEEISEESGEEDNDSDETIDDNTIIKN